MWWLAWFVVSFLLGWNIESQLGSGWFWAIATASALWAYVRWRRLAVGATPLVTIADTTAHHDPVHHQLGAVPAAKNRVQRSMIAYVAIMTVVLVVGSLSANEATTAGRTLLLEEDPDASTWATWSEGLGALDAEILGLAIYEWSFVVGMIVIALEVVHALRRRSDRRLWFLDSLASISTQVPFYFVEIASVLAMIGTYFVLWDNVALWQIPINGWTVVLAILAADFAYYWEHRTSHEIRLLWTGHAVHHSSPIFNTAVAFRFGPLEPVVAILFHLPLIMLGFHPALVIMGELTVQAYQFWIHTELIGKLGPVDRILNTPSNHRVHHGSDPEYLDRNHGGILMIWDRMFGTYQAEIATPTYGLTTQIDTVNPFKIWFSEFPSLFADLRNAESWRDWFGYLFNPPGWAPADRSTTPIDV